MCVTKVYNYVVRDFGVTLDPELTFTPYMYINILSRDCFYQFRQLPIVTQSLTASATSTLIHVAVTTRLHYCGSLYVGLPATLDRVASIGSCVVLLTALLAVSPNFACFCLYARRTPLHGFLITQRRYH